MGYAEIRYEVDGDVGIVTLDRPEARNALTHRTYAELEQAVRDTTARCLVVTGRDPAFCSGDDVKQIMANAGSEVASNLSKGPRITPTAKSFLETDVPVIAAVNGAAVGWGMELALMADIRVCSERAKFGELFVKRGLCCDVAGLGRLVQLVGREAASELLAGVEPWTAEAIEAALKRLCDELGEKPRTVYAPIRVAVTGSKVSPGLYESLALLGRERALERLGHGAEVAA